MKPLILMEVRQAHGLTSHQLAEAADVPLKVEYTLEIGGVVLQQEAEQIVQALSRLTGKVYTLEQFAVETFDTYLQAVVPLTQVTPRVPQ